MSLTKHATERIYGRTKMHPDDVLSIISAKAAIMLGADKKGLFYLFHSAPDNCAKIAVTTHSGKIISIWERDYFLPAGIGPVTREKEREARAVLQAFLFSRIKNIEMASPDDLPEQYHVEIEVYIGSRLECKHLAGEISVIQTQGIQPVLDAVLPELARIVSITDEVRENVGDTLVRYCICLVDPRRIQPVRSYSIKHKTLMRRIRRAT